jgi:hypothetical protein
VPLWAFLIITKMAKEIQLTQGKVAIVDDEDFEYLNQWKWFAHKDIKNKKFYAVRNCKISNNKRCRLLLHRIIIKNTNTKMHTDHCNGNTLDNRKINLRICTASENLTNKHKLNNNTSGYKGVFWHKHAKKWYSSITKNKITYNLGYFTSGVSYYFFSSSFS